MKVLLVHGLWNSRHWLAPLAWRLRRAGFDPELFGYASLFAGAEAAMPRLAERIAASGCQGVVGHSLGGLLALETLQHWPAPAVTRVVCLGSPLLGSATAGDLHGFGAALALGRSAPMLHRGVQPWPAQPAVGMIAGNVAHGFGRWFARLEGASDGTVAVAETRWPGLSDHCELPVGHSGLLLSAAASTQVAHFLREGRFVH